MQQRGRLGVWSLAAIAAAAAGYIWWDRARTESENGLEESLVGVTAKDAEPVPPVPPKAKLQLQLAEGDTLPLVKTVYEKITQTTDKGPVHSETTVQLVMAIRVVKVEQDRKLLRVDYRRVQYRQNLAGEKLEYDSNDPPRVLPPEVQAYHGLVNNGFRFWLGPDNRILKIEDFDGFLKRCVAHIPLAQRQEMLIRFAKTTGDEGVANFIDDSIGLLPYKKAAVEIGENWTRTRQILRPVPLAITQKCTLTRLTDEFAEIDISGDVVPSTTFGPSKQPQGGLRLVVTGGKIVGSCRIRLKSGLPERSEIHRTYQMIVHYPDGRKFSQFKETRTVIEVFTEQGAAKAIRFASGKNNDPIIRKATFRRAIK